MSQIPTLSRWMEDVEKEYKEEEEIIQIEFNAKVRFFTLYFEDWNQERIFHLEDNERQTTPPRDLLEKQFFEETKCQFFEWLDDETFDKLATHKIRLALMENKC